jgi:plastocyanin
MTAMEPEEEPGAPRGLLLSLGIIGIILGAAIAGEFVLRLQPAIGTGPVTVQAGVTSVLMPPNAAVANFSPKNITVFVGVNNTIQWTNQDTIPHTVYSSKVPSGVSSFKSAILNNGDTFKITLNSTGVYDYYCSIHPTTMKASIVVKSGALLMIASGTANQQLNYRPSSFAVVIGVNNTVTFVNQDSVTHTVTANDGSFDSKDIPAGQSWTHTFQNAGVFSFHCTYHPSFMKGTITVKSP